MLLSSEAPAIRSRAARSRSAVSSTTDGRVAGAGGDRLLARGQRLLHHGRAAGHDVEADALGSGAAPGRPRASAAPTEWSSGARRPGARARRGSSGRSSGSRPCARSGAGTARTVLPPAIIEMPLLMMVSLGLVTGVITAIGAVGRALEQREAVVAGPGHRLEILGARRLLGHEAVLEDLVLDASEAGLRRPRARTASGSWRRSVSRIDGDDRLPGRRAAPLVGLERRARRGHRGVEVGVDAERRRRRPCRPPSAPASSRSSTSATIDSMRRASRRHAGEAAAAGARPARLR